MAAETKELFNKVTFLGPVEIGTSKARYDGFLIENEQVLKEYKGVRDAVLFTNLRLVVIDPQGMRGKKVAITSVPWKSITAFSVENSGTFDMDAELKVSGSGFGICELQFQKGADMKAINSFVAGKILAPSSFDRQTLTPTASPPRGTETLMKTCPFCAEEIPNTAVECEHCKRELPLSITGQ